MKKTFKKLTAAFIAAAMAVTALPQTALAESEDFLQSEGLQPASVVVGEGDSNLYEGFRYKELEDGTLAITGYEGTETDITIPAEINGQAVTEIGNNAFFMSEITSVKIPDSVIYIRFAFVNCYYLQTIEISDSVVFIDEWAMQNCDDLTSINVDDNNPEYKDEDGILFTKDGKTLMIYPGAKTETSYTIPDSVVNIGSHAFKSNRSLESINIPAGVETIGKSTFAGCESLAAINVDAGNRNFKDEEGVLLTKDGKTFLLYPFGKSEDSYTIPDGVETIAQDAFSRCSPAHIKISEGVKTIEERAFYSCINLIDVEISASVVSADGAFTMMSCPAMTSFIVDGDNPAYKDVDGILFSKDGSRIVRFPVGKSDTAYSIPADVKTISKYAFADCRFTSIDIPIGVEIIDNGAFLECRNLTEVVIPDGVKTIGMQAFDFCRSLISVTIPASVTEIYHGAFTSNSPDLIMYGYIGSCAEAYANENNIKFVYMDALTFTDEDTGIEINAGEDALPADTKLTVEQTAETDTEVSFDITLTCNGEEIQPEGNVTVRIPVPEGWDIENIYVYHRDANGRLTEIKAAISGGYIIFTTNHFSEYLLSTTKLVTTTPCDVDGSGEVDELDSVALARYLASWDIAIDQSAADVDGNGDIDELDSVMLARKLAGWNV